MTTRLVSATLAKMITGVREVGVVFNKNPALSKTAPTMSRMMRRCITTNPETVIQNAIRVALSKRGIVLRLNNGVFYTESGQRIASGLPPGTSDLLFIGEGRAAFIEVKTPNGRVTPAQQHFIDVVRSHGVRAGVARSVNEAIKIIEGDI